MKKNKMFFKLIAWMLIQAFLIFDCAWAGGFKPLTQEQNTQFSTLAPVVNISRSEFQHVYFKLTVDEKSKIKTAAINVKGRVLVVEDEDFVRDLLKEVLTTTGYKVDVASNVEDALRLYASAGYDVVLTDYRLGKSKTAKDVAEGIRKTNPYQAIILMSADASEKEQAAVSADLFLCKPFKLNEVKEAVEKVINPKKSEINQRIGRVILFLASFIFFNNTSGFAANDLKTLFKSGQIWSWGLDIINSFVYVTLAIFIIFIFYFYKEFFAKHKISKKEDKEIGQLLKKHSTGTQSLKEDLIKGISGRIFRLKFDRAINKITRKVNEQADIIGALNKIIEISSSVEGRYYYESFGKYGERFSGESKRIYRKKMLDFLNLSKNYDDFAAYSTFSLKFLEKFKTQGSDFKSIEIKKTIKPVDDIEISLDLVNIVKNAQTIIDKNMDFEIKVIFEYAYSDYEGKETEEARKVNVYAPKITLIGNRDSLLKAKDSDMSKMATFYSEFKILSVFKKRIRNNVQTLEGKLLSEEQYQILRAFKAGKLGKIDAMLILIALGMDFDLVSVYLNQVAKELKLTKRQSEIVSASKILPRQQILKEAELVGQAI